MSILIKGMQKPGHCGYCRFRYDGICHALQKTQYSMDECPLVGIDDAGLNDTISRQATIDIIKTYAVPIHGYIGTPNDSEVYAYARGLLLSIERNMRALPSAKPEPRWIPVSESLPDGRLNKSYLVQDKDGRLAVGTYTNWGWMFGHYMADPVAWMPLPKPYERKEE